MMTNNEETSVYVVDSNFRLVSFNQTLKEVFPDLKIGDKCHISLCGEDMPCKGCPIASTNTEKFVLFYNKKVNRWVEGSTGELQWPGEGECHIIMTNAICEGNKNLFYNLTSLSAYDELFELNLTQNSYRILYHNENKYIMPDTAGELDTMLTDVVENMIHPDDRERFLEFWNLENIYSRMDDPSSDSSLKGQFRKKRVDGSYCWVLQTVVRLNHSENDDDVIMCFIQDINEQKLEEIRQQNATIAAASPIDRLTGIYKKTPFFNSAEDFIWNAGEREYCLMAIDIEHFKLFNEWYGQRAGDKLLMEIGSNLKAVQDAGMGIAGYIGEDDFCVILPNEDSIIKRLQSRIIEVVKQYGNNAGFLPVFGIYEIDDKIISVSTMYDKAVLALSSIKGNYAQRTIRYDKNMTIKIEDEQMLLSEVQRALKNGEFTFYAQPKCNMTTKKIVSLESLVRWIHPVKGVITPSKFIPVLENNGLITELDMYIWDKVCRSIRNWIDSGHRAVPISVNVSRVDIYAMDVVQGFKELVQKYDLEPRLLEIEITESIYAEQYDYITKVVRELRNAGFTVLMDDFGSGYSSLNMLKEVNVDVIKIDMKFLDMNEQSSGKGIGILEAISSMARLIGLGIIAEGVETKEQMELLIDMGCIYAQGYYFYRPMPIEVFEPLLSDENNIDFRGIKARQMDRIRIKEILNDELFSDAMMNNILGGIAFYSVSGDKVELVRVNEQYYRITGTNPIDLEERRQEIMQDIYAEDHGTVLDIFNRAYENRLSGAEGDVRRIKGDGAVIWMNLKAFFLREQNGSRLYYGSVRDVTAQKVRELSLESSQKELTAVLGIAENDKSFMSLTEDNRRIAATIFSQMTPGGMIGGYCEEDFPLYFANNEMIKFLGYSSYDEFAQAIDYKVVNTIHPDDRQNVAEALGDNYYPGMEYTVTYRMPKKDGTWFWTLDKGKVILAENGRMAIVSACMDISDTMEIQKRLTETNKVLLKQNHELNFLYNDTAGGYHHCADTPEWDFLYISNRFLEIFKYTREEIKALFDNKYLNMIHPDDRAAVRDCVLSMRLNSSPYNIEYRMKSRDGYIWVIDQSKFIELDGKRMIQGIVLNISDTVKLRDRMRMFVDNTPEDILLLNYKNKEITFEVIANGISRIMGHSADDYEKSLNSRFYERFIDKKRIDEIEKNFNHAKDTGEGFTEVIKIKTKHDVTKWMKLNFSFVKNDGNDAIYMCVINDITEEKKKEIELWLAGKRLESILRQAKINGWDWDIKNGRLTFPEESAIGALRGRPSGEQDGMRVVDNFPFVCFKYIPENYLSYFEEYVDKVVNGRNQNQFSLEIPLEKGRNDIVWIRIVCETIRNTEGEAVRAFGYYIDITEEKDRYFREREDMKTLEILRSQAIYDFKVNLNNDSFSDENSGVWFGETGCSMDCGYTEMLGYVCSNLVAGEYRKELEDFTRRERLLKLYNDGILTDTIEYRRKYMGRIKWFRMIVYLVKFEYSSDIFAYMFIMDIDEQKKREIKLTHLAHTDSLTGLLNRQAAIPIIGEYINGMKPDETAAIIMFDMDNFKSANDVFGHAYGDKVIKQTAERLKTLFRENDIVCRIGGDEFLVLCKNIDLNSVNSKMKNVIELAAVCDSDRNTRFTLSAGYCMIPADGTEFKELYQKSDIALFAAKMDGKRSFKKYEPSMRAVRYELSDK